MQQHSATTRVARWVLLLAGLSLSSACVHIDHAHRSDRGHGVHHAGAGHGPPPHAPAHGYRHKHPHHRGIDLVFDSGVGVYVVAGHTDLFFWDDHYYRWRDGGWQISARFDGGYVSIGSDRLPNRLARKHARHGHRKKHHPAKHKH